MNNVFMYKFQIIESIVKDLDFKTKEEVVELAKRMKEIALKNKDYSVNVKEAFEDAYNELASEDLTLENLLEIKRNLQ